MKIWREGDPILDSAHNIEKGGMFPHQREWWNSDHFIRALIAGYGAGKTFIGGKRSIALAMHNAPSPHLVVSPSYKMARRTTIPMIEALLAGKRSLNPDLKYRYHKTDHEFKIKWRGRQGKIWIASGDDPDSLKGPNVGSAWIDEPFLQAEEVFIQCIARVRDPKAKHKEIDLTGTPEQLNWGYDICEGEKVDNFDIGVVYAHTMLNKALGPEYVETLKKALTEKAAEAYLGGHFINLTEGRIYYGFNKSNNVVDIPDPLIELEVGMDFNVNPMAAIVFWRNGNHMHVIKEIELPNANTQYMCSFLKDNFKYPAGHQFAGQCRIRKIFPDSSGIARKTSAEYGRSDFTIIKDNGFIVDAPPANPHIRDRENAVNGKMSPATGAPTLTFSPAVKRLHGYMNKYTHEQKNKTAQKKMSHLLDALGYPVHRMFPIHRSSLIVTKLHGV